MVNKLNRTFKLTIQDADQNSVYYEPTLINDSNLRLTPATKDVVNNKSLPKAGKNAMVLEIPFTIEIDVNSLISDGYANTASIKIYGLKETNRNRLFWNPWNLAIIENGDSSYRKVILEAGYGTNIYQIFEGVLTRGYSEREGVEWATNLTCLTSAVGFYNTFINRSYEASTKQIDVINDIITEMSKYGDLKKGAVTDTLDKTYTQGISIVEQSYNVLTQFGVDVFVSNGKINLLQVNEAIGASKTTDNVSAPISNALVNKLGLQVPNISADTGLIGTPILNGDGFVTVSMIFEPTIKLGTLVNLKSATASFFNGYFKVMGINHKGVISSSKEGMLITTLKLFNGGSLFNNFNIVAPS
jgi:hypothetical protein